MDVVSVGTVTDGLLEVVLRGDVDFTNAAWVRKTVAAAVIDRHPSVVRIEMGEVAFLDIEARPDGAVLSFRNSEKVQAELTSILDAEAVCCSFLDLSVHPDGERLILVISAPPDAMPVVRDLTASFQGEQPTG